MAPDAPHDDPNGSSADPVPVARAAPAGPGGAGGPEGAGGEGPGGGAVEERWWTWIQAGAAALVFVAFLVTLRSVLNPFLLYLVLVALLLPFRGRPNHALLVAVLTLLTLFWLLATTGSLLAPFLIAMGLAYVLDPVVDHLEARGLGRTPAIAVLVVPVLALGAVAGAFGVPALGAQITELTRELPILVERFADWAIHLEQELERVPWLGQNLRVWVDGVDSESLVQFLEERRAEIARRIWQGVVGVGRGLGAVLGVLGYVVLTPVLTFYLLRDWDGLVARMHELLPADRRRATEGFVREYDQLLGQYLRGQITVALLMGLLTGLGLWLWSFPYAFLIGALVAVFSVIPYLGLVLSLLPAVIIALLSGNVVYALVKVAVVFGVVQGLEGTVISPRIVGESVGLHPVWILLAITAGGFFFGFAGLLLAVPAAAGIKLLAGRGMDLYRETRLYRGTGDSRRV